MVIGVTNVGTFDLEYYSVSTLPLILKVLPTLSSKPDSKLLFLNALMYMKKLMPLPPKHASVIASRMRQTIVDVKLCFMLW